MNYKEKIKAKGLKSSFIADLLGVKESTFSMYINGKRKKIPLAIEKGLIEILDK